MMHLPETHRRRAILEIDPRLLSELLQLPPDARIVDVRWDPSIHVGVRFAVEGMGSEYSYGQLIQLWRGIVRIDRNDLRPSRKITWGPHDEANTAGSG